MEKVKLFFLKNSVQIVAELVRYENGVYFVKSPLRVMSQLDKDTNQVLYFLQPHVPLVNEREEIDLQESDLLHTPKTPNERVVEMYMQNTSSLVLPKEADSRIVLNG